MAGRANPLLDLLHREAARAPLTFRAFMELALYHPEWGYYCWPGITLGREGDFITGPHQSPWFGRLLAKQLHQCWERLGAPSRFEAVEFGPGAGWLALDVLETIQARWPALWEAFRYTLVEVSAPLREAQGRLLEGLVRRGAAVRWLAPGEWGEVLSREGWEGAALAHEFLDAFPVHRVRLEGGELRELYVRSRQGELAEEAGPLSEERLEGYFPRAGVALGEGQVAEVNLAALDWVAQVGQSLSRGYLLIFDYGFSAPALYAPERAGGSLTCYRRHRAHHNPYARPGEEDITAHVDFSSLLREAEGRGFAFAGFTDLAHFLLSLGLAEELGAASVPAGGAHPREVLQAKALLIDEGLGGTIKALALAKDAPDELAGFAQKPTDRASWLTLREGRPPSQKNDAP
ncbi:MAG: class I SAM-dependent methyltransferase [Nitrospinota bacterium]